MSGSVRRRASEVSAEFISYGSNQCAAQPLREKQNKESDHLEGPQDATRALYNSSGRTSWERLELCFNLFHTQDHSALELGGCLSPGSASDIASRVYFRGRPFSRANCVTFEKFYGLSM